MPSAPWSRGPGLGPGRHPSGATRLGQPRVVRRDLVAGEHHDLVGLLIHHDVRAGRRVERAGDGGCGLGELTQGVPHGDHPDVRRVRQPGHGRLHRRDVGRSDGEHAAGLLVEPHAAVRARGLLGQPRGEGCGQFLEGEPPGRLGRGDPVAVAQVRDGCGRGLGDHLGRSDTHRPEAALGSVFRSVCGAGATPPEAVAPGVALAPPVVALPSRSSAAAAAAAAVLDGLSAPSPVVTATAAPIRPTMASPATITRPRVRTPYPPRAFGGARPE